MADGTSAVKLMADIIYNEVGGDIAPILPFNTHAGSRDGGTYKTMIINTKLIYEYKGLLISSLKSAVLTVFSHILRCFVKRVPAVDLFEMSFKIKTVSVLHSSKLFFQF